LLPDDGPGASGLAHASATAPEEAAGAEGGTQESAQEAAHTQEQETEAQDAHQHADTTSSSLIEAAAPEADMQAATQASAIWKAAHADMEAAIAKQSAGRTSLRNAEEAARQARACATQAAVDEASDATLLSSQKAAKGMQIKAAKAKNASRKQITTIMARYVDWDERTVNELDQPPGVLRWMVSCFETVRDATFRSLPVNAQRMALQEHMKSNPAMPAVTANKCKKFIRGVLEQGAYTLMRRFAQPSAPDAAKLVALAEEAECFAEAARNTLAQLEQSAASAAEAFKMTDEAARLAVAPMEEQVVSPVTELVLHTWLAGVNTPGPAGNVKRCMAPTGGWKLGMPVIVETNKGLSGHHSQIILYTESSNTWSVRHYTGSVSEHCSSELCLVPGYKTKNHTLCLYIAAYEAVSQLSTEQKHLVGWALQVRLCNDAFTTHVCTSRTGETFMELGPNCLHTLALSLPPGTGGSFVDIGAGTGLPLLVAACSGTFQSCFGVELNVSLVELYMKWQSALIACDAQVWSPITDRITLESGDFRHSEALKSHMQRASLVVCWNTCFEADVNHALFLAVSKGMTSDRPALLLLGDGNQTDLPSLRKLKIPPALAPNTGVLLDSAHMMIGTQVCDTA